jgi:cytoskeleton protein RodZ
VSEDRVPYSDSASPETCGGSPGTILRRCREFHGISLEEASETTKIGITHLKALEDDRIREFANQAYLKGFLRIYSTYLGLNSDDIARMYDKLFGVRSEKPDPARTAATNSRRSPRRLIPLKKLLFPVFLLAVILVTATFFKRPPPPLVRQPQPAAVAAPPQNNIAVQTVQSSVRNKSTEQDTAAPKAERHPVEPPEAEKASSSERQSDATKGFILKIKVTQNGTLTATVDGSGPQKYELNIGDAIEWKAENKVILELSNAGGVDVELNGKPYKSLGLAGKPVYVELDAEGVKQ